MTRKDYIKVAAMVKTIKDGNVTMDDPLEYMAKSLAQLSFEDNPRFDATRFYRACGLLEDAA